MEHNIELTESLTIAGLAHNYMQLSYTYLQRFYIKSLKKQKTIETLNSLAREEILFSYIIISVDFEFPSETKYPSIPCSVDVVLTNTTLRVFG